MRERERERDAFGEHTDSDLGRREPTISPSVLRTIATPPPPSSPGRLAGRAWHIFGYVLPAAQGNETENREGEGKKCRNMGKGVRQKKERGGERRERRNSLEGSLAAEKEKRSVYPSFYSSLPLFLIPEPRKREKREEVGQSWFGRRMENIAKKTEEKGGWGEGRTE